MVGIFLLQKKKKKMRTAPSLLSSTLAIPSGSVSHLSQLLTIRIGTDSSVLLPMATPPLRVSLTRTAAVAIPSSARRVALSSSPFLLRIGHSPTLLTLRNSITQAMPMDGASHHS